jgi:hypothetical protein
MKKKKRCNCKGSWQNSCKSSPIAYPTCITRIVLEEGFGGEGTVDNQSIHGMFFKAVGTE